MTIEYKNKINKAIRNYEGDNSFILSLKRYLKGNYTKKEKLGNREIKVLSDNQYQAVIPLLDI